MTTQNYTPSDVGFDDEDAERKVPARTERYKARKGDKDRIAVVLFKKNPAAPPGAPLNVRYLVNESPRFLVEDVHYSQEYKQLGYTICNKTGVCCERLGRPDRRIATLIIRYATDRKGNLQAKTPESLDIMPWALNAQKWNLLKSIHTEAKLQTMDLMVDCSNEDFQNLTFQACTATGCIWRNDPTLIHHVLSSIEKYENEVLRALGTKRTDAEILERMGVAVPPSGDLGIGGGAAPLPLGTPDYTDLLSGSGSGSII